MVTLIVVIDIVFIIGTCAIVHDNGQQISI